MRQTARWLGILSLAVLAVPARAADVEKYFPKETDAIISINVKQILDSDLIKKYALDLIKKAMKDNADVQGALTALGLDPLKDFERITIGGGGDDPTSTKAVVVVEGRFDPTKITDTATDLARKKGENIAIDKVNGKTIFKISTDSQPGPLFAAVVDSKTILLASDKELMGAALEAAQGSGKSAIKRELATLLAKADNKASLFMVAATKGKFDKVPVPDPNVKKVLEGVESLTAELRVEKDVKLQVAFGVDDEESAKVFQTMIDDGLKQVKQFVPLIAIQNPQLKPLGDLINNIKSSTKGKSVLINMTVSADAIDSIIKEFNSKDQ